MTIDRHPTEEIATMGSIPKVSFWTAEFDHSANAESSWIIADPASIHSRSRRFTDSVLNGFASCVDILGEMQNSNRSLIMRGVLTTGPMEDWIRVGNDFYQVEQKLKKILNSIDLSAGDRDLLMNMLNDYLTGQIDGSSKSDPSASDNSPESSEQLEIKYER